MKNVGNHMSSKRIVDVFNKDASILNKKKLWLLDMDGTIYNENTLFDGTLELLKMIEDRGGKYVFITNNSSRSLSDYVKKVTSMGIKATKDNFYTSVEATILFIKEKYPGIKIYVQGTKSMVKELKEAGLDVTEEMDGDIKMVLVGFDTELTSEKLRKTCELLTKKDVPFIATNCDIRCPVNFGYIPDCGSICVMIENATGKIPKYIGKPEPTMVEYAIKKYGFTKEETIIVGDRLYTDIASGNNYNITSVCVLSGEAKLEEIISGDVKPTFTFNSIKDII